MRAWPRVVIQGCVCGDDKQHMLFALQQIHKWKLRCASTVWAGRRKTKRLSRRCFLTILWPRLLSTRRSVRLGHILAVSEEQAWVWVQSCWSTENVSSKVGTVYKDVVGTKISDRLWMDFQFDESQVEQQPIRARAGFNWTDKWSFWCNIRIKFQQDKLT